MTETVTSTILFLVLIICVAIITVVLKNHDKEIKKALSKCTPKKSKETIKILSKYTTIEKPTDEIDYKETIRSIIEDKKYLWFMRDIEDKVKMSFVFDIEKSGAVCLFTSNEQIQGAMKTLDLILSDMEAIKRDVDTMEFNKKRSREKI